MPVQFFECRVSVPVQSQIADGMRPWMGACVPVSTAPLSPLLEPPRGACCLMIVDPPMCKVHRSDAQAGTKLPKLSQEGWLDHWEAVLHSTLRLIHLIAVDLALCYIAVNLPFIPPLD